MHIPQEISELSPFDFFTDVELANVLGGKSDDARYGLVKRSLKKGDLIRLKKGLYLLGEKFQRKRPNLFVLAQLLNWPSYISHLSALQYHGLIPEAVVAVTSATPGRFTAYKTPLGDFFFSPVPAREFFHGVSRVEQQKEAFLIATPEKALLDYVYIEKLPWIGTSPLLGSLRMESSDLRSFDMDLLVTLSKNYNRRIITSFAASFAEEFK
jgi:predicted transcriptional regulator of viral defense system